MAHCSHCKQDVSIKVYSNGWCKTCMIENARDCKYGKGAGAWAVARAEANDGKCELCGNVPKQSLELDHDHITGEWRGMICKRCNYIVGSLETQHVDIARVMAYLGKTPFDF